MNTKVSITAFFLLIAFGLNAQNLDLDGWIDDWRGLTEPALERSDVSRYRRAQRINARLFPAQWSKGVVSLTDGSIVEGAVNYNIARDLVQVRSKDSVRIFAANQIQRFEVYKDVTRVKRTGINLKTKLTTYYSLPYVRNNGYSRPKLFEVLVEGNTSLLRRWVYGTRYSDRKLYLRNPDGKITLIKKRRGQVIDSFDGKYDELRKFIKRERLDMYKINDVVNLVTEYNKLVDL